MFETRFEFIVRLSLPLLVDDIAGTGSFQLLDRQAACHASLGAGDGVTHVTLRDRMFRVLTNDAADGLLATSGSPCPTHSMPSLLLRR